MLFFLTKCGLTVCFNYCFNTLTNNLPFCPFLRHHNTPLCRCITFYVIVPLLQPSPTEFCSKHTYSYNHSFTCNWSMNGLTKLMLYNFSHPLSENERLTEPPGLVGPQNNHQSPPSRFITEFSSQRGNPRLSFYL